MTDRLNEIRERLNTPTSAEYAEFICYAKSDISYLLDQVEKKDAELASLTKWAVEANKVLDSHQWASCDGCGNDGYCPECTEQSVHYDSEKEYKEYPGNHKENCSIGKALASFPLVNKEDNSK